MRLRIHEFGGHDPVVNDSFESEEEPRLSVTVVHTTPGGTVAALKAAALLAKNLDVRLGLIAEPRKEPFEMIVIDHIEMPDEN